MTMTPSIKKQLAQFEKGLARSPRRKYSLRLYVTGMSPRSERAIRNITKICEEYLKGRYDLDVIDLYRHPEVTGQDGIIVAPTLIKKMPLPLKKLIGDMTRTDKVLLALDLDVKKKAPKKL